MAVNTLGSRALMPDNSDSRTRLPASETARVYEENVVADPLSEELLKLSRCVREIGDNLEEEHKMEFTSLADRAISLAHSVRTWLGQTLPGQVYWVDVMPGAPPKSTSTPTAATSSSGFSRPLRSCARRTRRSANWPGRSWRSG